MAPRDVYLVDLDRLQVVWKWQTIRSVAATSLCGFAIGPAIRVLGIATPRKGAPWMLVHLPDAACIVCLCLLVLATWKLRRLKA